VRRQTIESRRGTRCAGGLLHPPTASPVQPARALSSHDRPRCLSKRVSTPSFVFRSTPGSFPSSDEHNHHQIDQIRISGSMIGPRNFSFTGSTLLSALLRRSSLSNDDDLWKAFCGTPLTCSNRHHRIPSRTRVYLCVRIGFAGPCTYFCYDV
jgi:hypothetical protein